MTAIEELLIHLAERVALYTDSPGALRELRDLIAKAKAEAATTQPRGRTYTAEQYGAAFDENGNPRKGA